MEIKVKGEWGTICADHWTILEAAVACKHAGQGYAQSALPVSTLLHYTHLQPRVDVYYTVLDIYSTGTYSLKMTKLGSVRNKSC